TPGAPAAPASAPAPAAPAVPAAPGASTAAPPDPQAYAQPREIRQKLNIFDDGKLRVEPAQN
ncbi:motility protein MotB, partial [Pseudomonas syringae]|nr:motility protein MotB [Pseudomonas syringae]